MRLKFRISILVSLFLIVSCSEERRSSQLETATVAAVTFESPMVKMPSDNHPGILVRIDTQKLAELSLLQQVELQNFALPTLGDVTLELIQQHIPIAADSKLVVDGQEIAGGVRSILAPHFQVWRGTVAGIPGSRVFLALSEVGAQGFIEVQSLAEHYVHITPDNSGLVRIVDQAQLNNVGLKPPENFCDMDKRQASEHFPTAVPQPSTKTNALPKAPADESAGSELMMNQTVRLLRLDIETDYQLHNLLGSPAAVTNYVTGLIGAVSDQYLIDARTVIEIGYLGIHTTSDDGWTTQEDPWGSSGDLLDEFILAWTPPNQRPAQAQGDLAHFISGADIGGGVAEIGVCTGNTCAGVLCNQSEGFAVSTDINGDIEWDTWTPVASIFTWDFLVVAHEIGHNFGARHTHEYGRLAGGPSYPCAPGLEPLDRCWTSCAGSRICSRGTLMSYCHLLCGGLAVMDLYFHPMQTGYMRDNVANSCLGVAHTLTGTAPNSSPHLPPAPL